MNPYESHYVLLLPSHTTWTQLQNMIIGIWCKKKTPTAWAETSTTKIANGTRPHTPITNTNGRNNNFSTTHCTDSNTWTTKWKTLIMANCNLKEAAYRIELVFRWTEIWIWNNLNTAVRASRLSHVYSNKVVNKISQLETIFQSRNNACTHLLRRTEEMKFTKSTRAFKQLCNGKKLI